MHYAFRRIDGNAELSLFSPESLAMVPGIERCDPPFLPSHASWQEWQTLYGGGLVSSLRFFFHGERDRWLTRDLHRLRASQGRCHIYHGYPRHYCHGAQLFAFQVRLARRRPIPTYPTVKPPT